MHEVGRTWARRHGVTLETMFRYVPKSNDPGCSAGFGMGMVMHLGTQLILEPRKVIPSCLQLPTRFREYTCFHGSGHAFMRGYHGQLASAVIACKSLGARFTPDCAQGAFHDYWISLSGGDGTERPKGADTNPRSVCASYAFPRPCWYRFFWERKQSASVADEGDLRRLCRGVAGAQRAGCIGGASLLLARGGDPVVPRAHLRPAVGQRRPELPARCQRPRPRGQSLRADSAPAHVHGTAAVDAQRLLRLVRAHAERRHQRPLRALGLPTAEHLRGARRVCRGCAQARRAARHVLDSVRGARSSPAGDCQLVRLLRSRRARSPGTGRAGWCPEDSCRAARAHAPAATRS